MQSGHPSPSPLDAYMFQVLDRIANGDEVSIAALGEVCSRSFNWLPGFCDVIIGALRANAMIVVYEWEPGKIHVTASGQRWLETVRAAGAVPQ